jgi:Flp pilus assembly protein TadD
MSRQPLQDQAKARMQRHDWIGAAELLERDIVDHPTDPWSRMYLGSCRFELRNFEAALEHFRTAELLAPDESTPIGLQGDVFDALGQWEKAGELYRRALSLNPGDELAQKNLGRWTAESFGRRAQ